MKSEYRFYEFLKEYREFYNENNGEINTTGVHDFMAVIDGQQRLTSLYIGFRGTYAYKMPRKWWKNNEDSLPTRTLYLNLQLLNRDLNRNKTDKSLIEWVTENNITNRELYLDDYISLDVRDFKFFIENRMRKFILVKI